MAECIGHIFNGKIGGDWRCERCGLPYAKYLRERDTNVSAAITKATGR